MKMIKSFAVIAFAGVSDRNYRGQSCCNTYIYTFMYIIYINIWLKTARKMYEKRCIYGGWSRCDISSPKNLCLRYWYLQYFTLSFVLWMRSVFFCFCTKRSITERLWWIGSKLRLLLCGRSAIRILSKNHSLPLSRRCTVIVCCRICLKSKSDVLLANQNSDFLNLNF